MKTGMGPCLDRDKYTLTWPHVTWDTGLLFLYLSHSISFFLAPFLSRYTVYDLSLIKRDSVTRFLNLVFVMIITHLGPRYSCAEVFAHIPSVTRRYLNMPKTPRCHWHRVVKHSGDIAKLKIIYLIFQIKKRHFFPMTKTPYYFYTLSLFLHCWNV